MSRQAYYRVTVDGRDITSTIAPLLISLRVSLKSGENGDTATIELDDRDGQIEFPREGATVNVSLGWESGGGSALFKGKVDDVRSSGSRGGGRTMTITAKSVDTNSKAKEPKDEHLDDKTLEDAAKQFSKDTGIENVKIDPKLASIKREWWGMQNESFIHWGHRTAKEVGGSFKIMDDTALFALRNSGKSPGGGTLPTVQAAVGRNLISWDIAPVLGRPRFVKTRAKWFNIKKGLWKKVDVEVEDEGATATHSARHTRADEGEAQNTADSDKSETERNKGEGTVDIDGEASAEPEGTCVVSGARAGVDGPYLIDTVDHDIDRGGGWITRLALKQPKSEKSGAKSAGASKASEAGDEGASAGSSRSSVPEKGGGVGVDWNEVKPFPAPY
jgi:phage protein D